MVDSIKKFNQWILLLTYNRENWIMTKKTTRERKEEGRGEWIDRTILQEPMTINGLEGLPSLDHKVLS